MKPIVVVLADKSCPRCGARQTRMADECWLCGTLRGKDGMLGSGGSKNKFSFSLGMMLWINTIVACCSAIVVLLPGLGVLLSLIVFPVAMRTLLVIKRRRNRGIATNSWEKISLFASSFLRTTLLAIFACITLGELFVVGVLVLCLAVNGLFSGMMIVSLTSAYVTVVLWLLAIIVTCIEKRFHRDTARRNFL